jgi:hypothetical protein
MKTKKKELEVDIIGEQKSLTMEEQNAISEFLKQKKIASTKKSTQRIKVGK